MLTEEQKRIINSKTDIKRVIACAGSGKTTVITHHITDILNKKLALPRQILAITFTKNAAENMRKKIASSLAEPSDALIMDIFTFNAFGNEIVRENSLALSLGKDLTLINYSESWQILYEIISNYNFKTLKIGKDFGSFIAGILDYILELKKNLIRNEDFYTYSLEHSNMMSEYSSKALKNEEEQTFSYQKELFDIYNKYETLKTGQNLIDYADQILLPYFLFSEDKEMAAKYQKRYKYIFVDEFQDTDLAQGRLLGLIHKKGANKMIFVGDDDQGIYSFRGACIENIISLDRWSCFKGSDFKDFYLSKNFRSGKTLTDAFNRLLSKNEKRLEKNLKAKDKKERSGVYFESFKTHEEEASEIAKYIRRLINKGIEPKNIAILSRTRRFEGFKKVLESENIPFEIISSKNLFYEEEIQFLVSWLMVINDTSNEIDIVNILLSEKYKISYKDIAFVRHHADKGKTSLLAAIADAKKIGLSSESSARLLDFLEDLRFYMEKSYELRLRELIDVIFSRSGLKAELLSGFSLSYKRKIKNIRSFLDIATDFEIDREEKTFEKFITYLKDIAKVDVETSGSRDMALHNSVKIMTIHAAKGLEFEVVIIPFLWKRDFLNKRNSPGRFKIPAGMRKDNEIDANKSSFKSKKSFKQAKDRQKQEEERRIFYVACSRAKKLLILTHSRYESKRDKKEDKGSNDILPFLDELLKSEQKTEDRIDLDWLKGRDRADYFDRLEKTRKTISGLDKANLTFIKAINEVGDFDNDPELLRKKTNDYIKAINSSYPYCGKVDNIKISVSTLSKKSSYHNGINKTGSKIHSLSELLDYVKCPYLYYLRHVARVPEKISKSMIFGQRLHELMMNMTLLYYKDLEGKGGDIESKTKEDILESIGHEYPDGIIDAARCFKIDEIFHHDDLNSILLEQLHYLRIGDRIVTCQPDRIDLLNDSRIRLYEYKSSYPDGLTVQRYKNQLIAYNLLLSDIHGLDPESIDSSIVYIKDNTKERLKLTKEDTRAVYRMMDDAIDGITSNDFSTSSGRQCSRCEFEGICKKGG